MKVAVIGSRKHPDLLGVRRKLIFLHGIYNFERVITGGARGVDKIAEQFAEDNNIPCEVIRPLVLDDKFSYLLRNVEIITKADLIIAFWDGESKGTRFVINYALARHKRRLEDNTKMWATQKKANKGGK